MTSYTPAQVTEKTGFTIDTLRYYERIGLLHHVGRTAGGRRVFTDQDVEFLQLLRCLRYTGMPVAEMLRFVSLLRSGEATREERVEVLRDHERRVAAQISRLQEHQDHIQFKIRLYSGAEELAVAPA
ncbi:MerR family transcriptional regulator [Amycolatopsis sp. SID8362]|uniref:MerR family transcriptional regulator n=1 Tax=Amycolatopsis sp. SID8362 TaxID=2690346 RepID=UPI00136DA976|nr:MerR family transcriptional regulator [Amycolatopsis sp. SID8362]NBH10199.1 MerR family transcriptional regulator [Amycolatopsis sp. SID8362]NED46894.1 MerR family transcriptional regulator [Amycolatopsis sp. SID8362]